MASLKPKDIDMLEGWLGVLLSSTACVVGGRSYNKKIDVFNNSLLASIVFLDKFFKKSFLDSRPFMAASLSLASGVLLFSSLSILFPQAQKRLNNDALLYTCYFGGATFTLVLTKVIHFLMPDAIHACGDASEECHHAEEVHHHHHEEEEEEQRKLNDRACDVEYGTIRSSESHFRFHHDDQMHGSSTTAVDMEPDIDSECPSAEHHYHHESVEETVTNDPNHFYSIGLQTAVAICVHKFPGKSLLFSCKTSN